MAEGWFFESFLLLFLFPPLTFSLSDSEALLRLKKQFTINATGTALDSWVSGSRPCNDKTTNWDGLFCHKDVVVGLRLDNMGLSGKIDIKALKKIKNLKFLSIMNNSFQGTIPELNRLVGLKALYLSGNQFSGHINSYYFSGMESLKKVWLSRNKFNGSIPLSLGQLKKLTDLRLDNNKFIGHIPAFVRPDLGFIDLSNNKLCGEIPGSLSKFNASSFAGNPGLCGHKLGVECVKTVETSASKKGKNNANKPQKRISKTIIALIIMSVMSIIVIFIAVFGWMRRKKKKEGFNESVSKPIEVKVTVPTLKQVDSTKAKAAAAGGRAVDAAELVMINDKKRVFGMSDLMKSAAELLGNGELGSSFKVKMSNGVGMVVKRMKDMDALGKDEFDKEIKRLGKLQHPNVLTPLAYLYKNEEQIFVYEHIRNGCLLYQLHGVQDDKSHAGELDWPARLKIIQGIASGLDYLHMELSSLDVPHGNLKSSNILLGPDNHPFLTDYGFRPFVNAKAVNALFAYKIPDAVQYGKVTPKSDVYCLGIVILEILTGHVPSQYLSYEEGGTDVVEWAASAFSEGTLVEMLDPEITGGENPSLGSMERLLHIGLLCTEISPEIRLSMKEAARMIEEIQV